MIVVSVRGHPGDIPESAEARERQKGELHYRQWGSEVPE